MIDSGLQSRVKSLLLFARQESDMHSNTSPKSRTPDAPSLPGVEAYSNLVNPVLDEDFRAMQSETASGRRSIVLPKALYILFDFDSGAAFPLLEIRTGGFQCFGCEVARGSRSTFEHVRVCNIAKLDFFEPPQSNEGDTPHTAPSSSGQRTAASYVSDTFTRRQEDLESRRRGANDTFNMFLHCVNGSFQGGTRTAQLDMLHECHECEIEEMLLVQSNPDSPAPPCGEQQLRRRLRGVVVDCNATDILLELPPYIRHIVDVVKIPNTPRRFILSDEGGIHVQKESVMRLTSGATKGCSKCGRGSYCPNFYVRFKG